MNYSKLIEENLKATKEYEDLVEEFKNFGADVDDPDVLMEIEFILETKSSPKKYNSLLGRAQEHLLKFEGSSGAYQSTVWMDTLNYIFKAFEEFKNENTNVKNKVYSNQYSEFDNILKSVVKLSYISKDKIYENLEDIKYKCRLDFVTNPELVLPYMQSATTNRDLLIKIERSMDDYNIQYNHRRI